MRLAAVIILESCYLVQSTDLTRLYIWSSWDSGALGSKRLVSSVPGVVCMGLVCTSIKAGALEPQTTSAYSSSTDEE